ncbi:efflux RND transporter permease subunit [Mariniphaga sediminis]|uniref:Efflux RND transporter permease subunit n=1 Tax=Mariniphaga sediminis TaxID=1628158 RepID=A0A399D4Z3_9BACT|nr:efflux RND transporter permease subunit [Mariniphaga sediminis]RIH64204.1 efflux RND transporter permease subunit [Mariniphaga sediminis]RIH66483.1 efflux RND transporter permease subunit [Mariniphaga sediminis]
MNLTKVTLNNSRITLIAILVVAIIGIGNYFELERDSMPPYTVRIASVVTQFPGADPQKVEALVTEPLEEIIREVAEVKTITSESRPGLSVITVELVTTVDGKELQSVWTTLRNKVEDLKPVLPQGIFGPVVKDEDIGTVFGIILGVTGDGVSYNKLEDYAKDVRDELLLLPDAAKIKYGGVQEERIFIEFDDKQLAHYGLDAMKLRNIVSATNILYPGGEINMGRQRIVLEPSGSFETIADLQKILIPTSAGTSVYLEDITSRIYRDYITPRQKLVKINGKPAVALFISLKDGANIVRLGEEVDEALVRINSNLPLGVEVVRSASQDQVVHGQVNDFLVNLAQSILIVLAVMLLFLGFRTGSLVALLIPMVILTSFFFLEILHLGFNKVSLAALIISLGLLVDNGIVISESIMVSMKRGLSAFEASVYSGKILLIPLLISSLTTSAAFLPFALARTPMGEISSQLFWVVSTTLLASWFLAFTFIPLLAVLIVKIKVRNEEKKENFIDRNMQKLNLWYNRLLFRVLKKPFLFLGFILVLFVVAVSLVQFLPFKLVPDSDRNLVTVDIKFPSGTQMEYTEQAVNSIGDYILENLIVNSETGKQNPGVLDFSSFIGEGPEPYDLGYFKNEANSSYAHMLLNTTGDRDNDYIIAKVDSFCFYHIPDADIRVNRLTGAGASGTPVEIRISGSNPETLAAISEKVKEKLVTIEGAKNITDNWGPKIKKLVVSIDPDKAQRSGLTNMEIALALNAGLSGMKIGDFFEADEQIPIFLKNENSDEHDIETVQAFNIYSPARNQNVPLSQVANVEVDWQFGKVIRKDLKRTMTVGAYLEPGYNASDIFEAIGPWMDEQKTTWDLGYEYELGGEDEDKAENLGAIFANLPLAFFIIVLLLVLQFNSIRKATIIVLSIPLGMIGVVAGWFIGGSFVSFFGVLGVIALAGIVVNNSIILIDRIDVEITEKPDVDRRDAILKAANNRFRPVILTTLTTSMGMLPLWFSGDLLWEPLTLAIIFGLFFATMITLLFVPVLYRLFFKVPFNGYKLNLKMLNSNE